MAKTFEFQGDLSVKKSEGTLGNIVGNTNADTTYFDEDLTLTMDFGKYKTSGGKVTIPTKTNSMSVADLFKSAFTDDSVAVTQPSASLRTPAQWI